MSDTINKTVKTALGTAAASALVGAGKLLFELLKKYPEYYENANEAVKHPVSLTQRAKECFIESRAYIDKDIAHEKVTTGILKLALTLNSSLVLAGLRLDGLVESGITVSNRLKSIATEDYIDTAETLRADAIALETVDPKVRHDLTQEEHRLEKAKIQLATDREKLKQLIAKGEEDKAARIREEIARQEAEIDKHYDRIRELSTVETSDVTPTTDVNLAVGKVIEVTLTGSQAEVDGGSGPRDAKVTIPLFIRINPYLVDSELVSYMMEVSGHGILSGKRRAQLKAGEISWLKDYVFGMDIVRRTQSILKKDLGGEFANFLESVGKKNRRRWVDIYNRVGDKTNYRPSSNLANAILVFSRDAVERGRINNGVNLDDFAERQNFFDKTYASMIFIVDPNHERVSIYLNGFKDVGNYSYNDFIHKKDLQGDDFMTVLRSVTQGQISRF